ncbi:DnaB-like helicase N-terminal domain-containing protein [Paludibacterium denitrificans]|uniref:DNA helicase DnaB-like N-terminal domain-containing protein n=1 Tax=Paludibacterium denitrificans TaxID=2675226 RepID=A0A844GED1_9NEIS|nr:DnaB-like helicase N-terminal domain-containing protein [Paludibacterium denitrificans]MTD34009.1 hypothetical protein [Paludibacterium denitrificans]
MIPLHSHESEQSVIGAMLIDPRRLDDVLDVISSSDFYDPSHRTIFGAIEAVHLNKMPVDVVTVGEQLETRGELEAAGGYGYMADLAKNIPSAANVMRYVKIVNERSLRRRPGEPWRAADGFRDRSRGRRGADRIQHQGD